MHHKPVRPGLRLVAAPVDDGTAGVVQPATTDTSASTSTTGAPASEAEKPLGEGGIRALQAERDARATAEKALADLTRQVEDSKKTAEQKAADDLRAAQDVATAAAARALRYEVAAAKDGDELKRALALAPRLVGTTKEELARDLDGLLAEIGKAPATGPRPDRSQGAGDADKGASVTAGRDLYVERHPSKTTTT